MKLARPPICSHGIAQNVFFKMMSFSSRGDYNHGHKHTYDHLTVLCEGAIEVHCEGKVGRFRAPHLFLTPKEQVHQFFALESNTLVTCVHALRDPDVSDDIVSCRQSREEGFKQVSKLIVCDAVEVGHESNEKSTLSPFIGKYQESIEFPQFGDQVLTATCANTTVTLHKLDGRGCQTTLVKLRDHNTGHVAFLSVGSVSILSEGITSTYDAPYMFLLPDTSDAKVTALSDHALLIEVRTFGAGHDLADTYHTEITLDAASERLRTVLREIDAQTTVVKPYLAADDASCGSSSGWQEG